MERVHAFSSSPVTWYPSESHQGKDFHGTPAALRLQTGAEDLDAAFLDLIDRAEAKG